MSPPKASCFLSAVVALLAVMGCSGSYHYMRDTTPQLERMRFDYVRNNPGNKYNEDILVGRVKPGMSKLQVRITWGDPDHAFRGDRPGIDELWTYGEDEPSRGVSIYQLRFAGERLQGVEVERGTIPLGMTPLADAVAPEDDIRSGSGTKPNR